MFGNDFYIGQTINLMQRIKSHKNALKNGKAANKLQDAYEKTNGSFSVEIVEEISADKDKIFLDSREEYYINSLHPTLNGDSATCGMTEKDRQRCEQNINGYGAKYLSPLRPDLLISEEKHIKTYNVLVTRKTGKDICDFLQGKDASAVFKAALREYIKNHTE